MKAESWWTDWWFWFLLFVAVSWLVMELDSILEAHTSGQRKITDYTLSDTIRRWSAVHKWLAPLTIGVCAGLMWHFFGQTN